MKLHIDGTAEDGWTWEGGSRRGPFVVFDEDAQANVAGPFRWHWQARLVRWYLRQDEKLRKRSSQHNA